MDDVSQPEDFAVIGFLVCSMDTQSPGLHFLISSDLHIWTSFRFRPPSPWKPKERDVVLVESHNWRMRV